MQRGPRGQVPHPSQWAGMVTQKARTFAFNHAKRLTL